MLNIQAGNDKKVVWQNPGKNAGAGMNLLHIYILSTHYATSANNSPFNVVGDGFKVKHIYGGLGSI